MTSFTTKFEEFKDEDAQIVYDVDEEKAIQREMEEKGMVLDKDTKSSRLQEKFTGINLESE